MYNMITTNKIKVNDRTRSVHWNKVDINSDKIPKSAYYNNIEIEDIAFDDTILIIGERAFALCYNLIRVDFGDSVEMIDDESFAHCSALREILLPPFLKRIGTGAFLACHKLEFLIFPPSLKIIDEGAFYGCTSVEILKFVNYQLTNIPILHNGECVKNSLQEIGIEAFRECCMLTKLELPPSLKIIGECAFYGCNSLVEVEIPESVIKVNPSAFEYCTSLELLYLNRFSVLSSGAFANCYSLSSIILADDEGISSYSELEDILELIGIHPAQNINVAGIKLPFQDNPIDYSNVTLFDTAVNWDYL